MSTDSGWITEALVQFTRSPVWNTPVNDFIDDNCGVFDSDEEMKLEYTNIHNKFKALVDGLLTNFVQELGIPLEDALAAVKSSLSNSLSETYKLLKRLMNYIFMVEDFQSFQRMMVKRNIELDILATQALRAHGVALDGADAEQMQAILQSTRLDDETLAYARAANGDTDEDTALQNAIAASLQEQGTPDQRHALEAAMLQEALALSVQAEKERARLAAEEVEKEAALLAKTDAAAANKLREEKLNMIEERKGFTIESLHAHVLEAQQRNDEKYSNMLKGIEISVAPSADLKETPPPAPVAEPLATTETVSHATVAAASPKGTAATTTTTPTALAAAPTVNAPAVALPPIGGRPGGALPPIQSHAPLRPLPSTAASAPAPEKARTGAGPAAGSSQKPTKEELEARAKHMKEQRERILAQNKAKRHQELSDYATQNGSPAPATSAADSAAAAHKQMTVDIARRLREDMVQESTKGKKAAQ